jgi:K+-sensing histidine kinase KdpD
MARFLYSGRVAIAAGLVAPFVVAAVLLPLRASWSNTNVALVLVVMVVAVAAMGNRVAGAVAALSAAAWFDFFFTRPYERFAISKSADVKTAVLLFLVGLAVSQLAARARRLQVIAITDARYLAQIHDAAELTKSATSSAEVVDYVRQQLTELLDLKGCRFEYGSLLGHPPRLEPDGNVMVGHYRWELERWGLPTDEIELRTFADGQFCGRFMLQPKPGSKPSLQARLVAVTLADQAGRALGSGRSVT